MKISNFKYWSKEKAKEFGNVYVENHATVDTCSFFFVKKRDVEITKISLRWCFNHNGEYLPAYKANALARSADIAEKINTRGL